MHKEEKKPSATTTKMAAAQLMICKGRGPRPLFAGGKRQPAGFVRVNCDVLVGDLDECIMVFRSALSLLLI